MAVDATHVEAAIPTGDGGLSRSHRRRLLTALSITQTVGYGILYYAFSVLLTPIAADLHTGDTTVTGALTLCIVVTGAAAIPVGRWLDRHGGRTLMTTGSILGGVAVAAWSQIHTIGELYTVLAVIGLVSAMTLYEPAFAIVVDHTTPHRRAGALLTVTIVAGFASSIFLPVTGALTAHLGWRRALLILAAVYVTITVPLHATAVPRHRNRPSIHDTASNPPAVGVRDVVHDTGFWVLLTAFTAQGAAVAVIGVDLVSYLIRLGHSPAIAAAVAGLLGVLSVTGRLAATGLRRRHSIAHVTAAVFAVQAAGIAALPLVGSSTWGALTCVTVFGLGFGVATIARPAMLADRYGTTAYATISGAMSTPMNLAKAATPLGAAAVAASAAGYPAVMYLVAAACVLAAALLATEHHRPAIVQAKSI